MKIVKKFLTSINEETEYQNFFKKKLSKWKIKTPMELNKEEKKKFFDEVDKDWKSEKEK